MEIFVRFLLLFCRILGYLLTPIVKLFYKKHQQLPVINNESDCLTNDVINEDVQKLLLEEEKLNLLLIPASDLVMDIKSGKVKERNIFHFM